MPMHLYQEIGNRICNYCYVCYDLNLVGTPEELTKTTKYLNKEFKMKDLGKTKFFLGL